MFASSLGSTLLLLVVALSLVLAVTATPVLRVPPAHERSVLKRERQAQLTNGERIARGLPLNKPRRHFDSESMSLTRPVTARGRD